jgi:hypothetical protein
MTIRASMLKQVFMCAVLALVLAACSTTESTIVGTWNVREVDLELGTEATETAQRDLGGAAEGGGAPLGGLKAMAEGFLKLVLSRVEFKFQPDGRCRTSLPPSIARGMSETDTRWRFDATTGSIVIGPDGELSVRLVPSGPINARTRFELILPTDSITTTSNPTVPRSTRILLELERQ